MRCVRCGGEIPQGTLSCPGCGLKLRQAPQAPSTPAPPPEAGPPYAAPFVPGQGTGAAPGPAYQDRQPPAAPPESTAVTPPEYQAAAPPEYRPAVQPPAPPEYNPPGPPEYNPAGPPPGPPPGPPEYNPAGPPRYSAPGAPAAFVPPQGYGAPGPAAPPPQGQYWAPGELPPPGQYPQYGAPPVNPYGQAGDQPAAKSKFPLAIVAIVVAGLLVIGGTAIVYFKFLKKTTYTGPQAAVAKYFEVLPTGDAAAVKALFAPDAQPSEANLNALKIASSMGASIKYENPKMQTLTETATDASVQLNDLTISVSMAGQSVKQPLSAFTGGAKMVIYLKKVNGQWLLIANNGKMPDLLNLPGGTSGGSGTVYTTPQSSGSS